MSDQLKALKVEKKMITKEQIWFRGYIAQTEGKGQDRNPFQKGTGAEQWWNKGWSDAQSDEEARIRQGIKAKPIWRKKLETLMSNAWAEIEYLVLAAFLAGMLIIIPLAIFEGLRPWGGWIFGTMVVVIMIFHHIDLALHERREINSIQPGTIPMIEDPLQLLSKRWKHLPDSFLQWIVTWLTKDYQVEKFIELSEEYRLHTEAFPEIANGSPELFNWYVATALSKIANHYISNLSESTNPNPEDVVQYIIKADDLLSLAVAFQSKNAVIVLSLAAVCHMRQDYPRALELFDEGLPLMRKEITSYKEFRIWLSQQPSMEGKQLRSIGEMISPETIKEYEQMRDDCLIHLRATHVRNPGWLARNSGWVVLTAIMLIASTAYCLRKFKDSRGWEYICSGDYPEKGYEKINYYAKDRPREFKWVRLF